MLDAISPIDGRYYSKTKALSPYFSEAALIKYRVRVEIAYLKAFAPYSDLPETSFDELDRIVSHFNADDAQKIKEIEATTNHDVKAVEYFIKEKMQALGLEQYLEFVHFGLTSQDINNTAVPLSIKEALHEVYLPKLQELQDKLKALAILYKGIPMLARTHGQAASPTTVGKEIEVFTERLDNQLDLLKALPIRAKFGGATGNFNAHKVSYSEVDWVDFGDRFVSEYLSLERSKKTTQIAHYDGLSALFDNLKRINIILIDLARDFWTYISMDYFKQRVIANEVGSSAMPHKVNPIDFENAEGNFGMANAILSHLSDKLPISRLQRDLTDSTVLRNVGVPFGHVMIAFGSLLKGLNKIDLNESKLSDDLDQNWAVVAEAIQNILRREGVDKPYEKLKSLTRGNQKIDQVSILAFIDNLEVSEAIKAELRNISPHNYIGYY